MAYKAKALPFHFATIKIRSRMELLLTETKQNGAPFDRNKAFSDADFQDVSADI
jgi:hypothetical protein